MKETRFKYKGIDVTVQEDHPNGKIIVGDREFKVFHHHAGGLAMWACEEAYFTTPDILELARHFVDYGYMFNAPGRIVVPGGHIEHEGEAPPPTTSPAPIESQQGKARPPAKKKRARKSNLGG